MRRPNRKRKIEPNREASLGEERARRGDRAEPTAAEYIVNARRGFKRPLSFHDPRLREERVGYFFDVITNGFGQMPSYAAQIPPRDRWAIVAYIRALQLSQGATLDDVPADVRGALERGETPATGTSHEGGATHD